MSFKLYLYLNPPLTSTSLFPDQAHRVFLSEGEKAPVPGRPLPLPPAHHLRQIPGAHGVRSAHHPASWVSVTGEGTLKSSL
jgi:hypothetical protein